MAVVRKKPVVSGVAKMSAWGNSLGLRIPKDVAASAGLKEGSEVTMEARSDGTVLLRPASVRRRYTATELCAGVEPGATGGEIDWGRPVGKEIW